MAWIESHQEIARHPKTRRAARALGVSLPTMIGHLHLLWWWALDFADDGDLSRFNDEELAEAAMWEGEPSEFVAALASAGFLDRIDDSLALHDWDEYAGKLVDQRKANAERQRRYRERHRNEPTTQPNDKRNATPNRHVTVTSQSRNAATGPDRTVPITTTNVVGAGPTSAADAAPPSGGVFERYSERLKNASNRVAVLMAAFAEVYGDRYKPDAGRIGAMAKALGAGEFLRLMIRAAPDWRGVDDPHDFLAGAAKNAKADREKKSASSRLVDEPAPNGSTNYVAMIQARQKGQIGVRQDEAPGDGDDNRGPPAEG